MHNKGSPDPSKDDPSPHRRRIANRFQGIKDDHRSLKAAMERYDDRDAFVGNWASRELDARERVAAIERFYERIVNDLQQIVDATEEARVERGEIEDPSQVTSGPGRWRRLEIYGVLPDRYVEPLKRLAEIRNVFQKEYADLDLEKGGDVYEDIREFLRLVPKVIPSLRDWVDEIGP